MEFFFATLCLFTVTIVASFIYYKRIQQAHAEYESSKDVVRVITSGFSQQLRKVAGSILSIEKNATDAYSAAAEALRTSAVAVEVVKDNSEKVSELSVKMDEADKTVASLREEIQSLARRRPVLAVQPALEGAIPLRQDAVLDQLTPTELGVLMLIEETGEASGPAIREKVNKTREHTARLLKKLFDSGFINRNTSGMPYRYSVRKEIKELIQQQKENTQLSL
jgi:DNA-binding MarR family transcriptional regulator